MVLTELGIVVYVQNLTSHDSVGGGTVWVVWAYTTCHITNIHVIDIQGCRMDAEAVLALMDAKPHTPDTAH